MADTIPKWIMERYAALYKKYKEGDFTFQEAMKTVKEDDKVYMSMVLSELRKSGWLEIKINPDDARKRIYKLFSPESVVQKIELKERE